MGAFRQSCAGSEDGKRKQGISLRSFNKRGRNFFKKSAEYVGRGILGDLLVVNTNNKLLIGKIVETESYLGIKDDASHSFNGKVTKRNKITYGDGGFIYVYLIYGKYWCFNIVVSKKNDPQTVFIRAIEPLEGINIMRKRRGTDDIRKLTNGPCCWTQSFGIDRYFSGKDITLDKIFIASQRLKNFEIVQAKRVGVDYARNAKSWPLRFYIKNNSFVSKR